MQKKMLDRTTVNKHLKVSTLALIAVCTFNTAQANDIKSQSQILQEGHITKGDYHVLYESVKGTSGGIKNIVDITPEANQPNEHFVITLKPFPHSKNENEKNTTETYFPDDISFPITYMKTSYLGNPKLQKKIGYAIDRKSHTGQQRLVFVDDYIFVLNFWKNKDNYELTHILSNKVSAWSKYSEKEEAIQNFRNFLKGFSQGVAELTMANSTVDAENLKKNVLQPYLDNATLKQKSYYATWIKNPVNKKTKQYLDDLDTTMTEGIRNYSKEIYHSPAHQGMLVHRKGMVKKSILR